MTMANVVQGSARGLPQPLKTAQDAIHLPDVQEMLRRLSAYQLGIFMPHKHDETTGEFQALPDNVMQVESAMKVSFVPLEEMARRTDRFFPVAWLWRAGAPAPVAACEMEADEAAGIADRIVKHKM